MNCLMHMDRPGSYVSASLGQPMWLWLCPEDVAIWKSRGIAITTVEASAGKTSASPPADGTRPADASTAAVAPNRAPSESAPS